MIFVNILILFVVFWGLSLICDLLFVPSLEKISKKLKLSSEFAGATLMAVGSSAPELFTSIFAITQSNVDISMGAGTIVGSAIFNILVIIGASAMVKNIKLSWKPIIRDLSMYIVALVLLLVTFWDGKIVLWESVLYIIFYIIYVWIAKNWSKWLKYSNKEEQEEELESEKLNLIERFILKITTIIIPPKIKGRYYIFFLISIFLIGFLTHIMVNKAVFVATFFGMSPALIGLTILAMGTSIPDLLSSLSVAKKGKGDMAVTNAVGSNIFDILFGLGLPYVIYFMLNESDFIPVNNQNLQSSMILLFATVVVVLFLLLLKKRKLTRFAGFFLILLYLIYLGYNIYLVL